MTDPRQIIRDRAAARGLSLSSLSILAGCPDAYIGDYLDHETPAVLPSNVQHHVALVLDLDEPLTGAMTPWLPAVGSAGHDAAPL